MYVKTGSQCVSDPDSEAQQKAEIMSINLSIHHLLARTYAFSIINISLPTSDTSR